MKRVLQTNTSRIKVLKEKKRGRISETADEFPEIKFHEGVKNLGVAGDIAIPSATQNEINKEDALNLVKNGILLVAEAANMPCSQDAVEYFIENNVLFGPAKAVNAGGVGVSGLEMSQNSARIAWDSDHLAKLLEDMMKDIHTSCVEYGKESGQSSVNYLKGANIAGFVKVADAMLAYGHV